MEMEIVFSGGKRVNANFDGFTVRTDQSISGGGEGSAPEPFDLFFASMGGYALSKYEFRGRAAIMAFMVGSLRVPSLNAFSCFTRYASFWPFRLG